MKKTAAKKKITTGQSIQQALDALQDGKTVSRATWPDNVTLRLMGGHIRKCVVLQVEPRAERQSNWIATHDELFATDWRIHDSP